MKPRGGQNISRLYTFPGFVWLFRKKVSSSSKLKNRVEDQTVHFLACDGSNTISLFYFVFHSVFLSGHQKMTMWLKNGVVSESLTQACSTGVNGTNLVDVSNFKLTLKVRDSLPMAGLMKCSNISTWSSTKSCKILRGYSSEYWTCIVPKWVLIRPTYTSICTD